MATSLDTPRALVIGGGVVGLACALELAQRGAEVVLVERHRRFGEETSSRNSEVVHAGIYYPPESLKAQLCVEGRLRLLAFCDAKRVPYRLCGKLIVACSDEERPALDTIEARAAAAGATVPLQRWSAAQVAMRAPAVRAVEALWSGGTGIVDAHALMAALARSAEAAGACLLTAHRVVAVDAVDAGAGHRVVIASEAPGDVGTAYTFDLVVNAAGHGAPAVAALAGLTAPRQFAVKGSYFALVGPSPADTLVYPVPRPGLVGLGTHLTIDLAGRGRLGPDVEVDALPFDHHVDEARGDAIFAAARHFLPGLRRDQLRPDYAGFRPKLAVDRFADFEVRGRGDEGRPGWVDLFGIESPGLTAALALAARAVGLALAQG